VELIFDKNEIGRKGAGYARNLGLERARGKWIIFADADDFFNPCFEKALDKYKDYTADMICLSSNAADCEDVSIRLESVWYSMQQRIKKALAENNEDIIRYDTGVVWGRFIKRELILRANARFQETRCRNDTLFAVQAGCAAKEIILDETLEIYCYTRRKNSIMSCRTKADEEERYLVFRTVMMYLRKQKKGYPLFNNDLLASYDYLQNVHLKRWLLEFPVILLLTTTKKHIISKFIKTLNSKLQCKANQLFRRKYR
jgi:glycosyltransferase involved in cell wall biosynthesis